MRGGQECLKPALVRLDYVYRYGLCVIQDLTFDCIVPVIGLGQGFGILSILYKKMNRSDTLIRGGLRYLFFTK